LYTVVSNTLPEEPLYPLDKEVFSLVVCECLLRVTSSQVQSYHERFN
jgi:hypothetical protein